MKKIIRHIFKDGTESVSDNPNTVLTINKQEPVKIVEDFVYEEDFSKHGYKAVSEHDRRQKKEKEKKDKMC